MKKYLIVESDIRNAFMSDSRNTKKHLADGTDCVCCAYDRHGNLVSEAMRDNEKIFNVSFEPEQSERMAELWKKLNG